MELQHKCKETIASTKERPKLLVEVKTETCYKLRTMAKKNQKIWTDREHINAPANHTNI